MTIIYLEIVIRHLNIGGNGWHGPEVCIVGRKTLKQLCKEIYLVGQKKGEGCLNILVTIMFLLNLSD